MAVPGPELPEYSYARRRSTPVLDPALRRIALGAGAVSVLVIVVALLWSGLRPGAGLGFDGAPPLIAAPTTPLRVAPANPGGLTVPGANEQIMSGAPDAGAPQLAPAAPQANVSELQQAETTHTPKPPPPAPAAPTVAPPPSSPPPATTTGAVEVQLAATSTEAAAHRYWATLAAQKAGLLAGHSPLFIPATVDGKAVWRLRLPGFNGQAAATAFCASLKAQGVACTVAGF